MENGTRRVWVMPKRNTLPHDNAYTGAVGESKLIVQKSNPLQMLANSDLRLTEIKILDLYLARIDSHAPERRTVRLTNDELVKALGVSRIRKNELTARLDSLIQRIKLPADENHFHSICLFSRVDGAKNEYGEWTVELTCSEEAMQYIFNIESLGYLRYKLSKVIKLRSRYSYFLFLYIEDNRYKGTWKVSLKDLKNFMGYNPKETEENPWEYRSFNLYALKPAQAELKEQEVFFEYKPIRRSHKVAELEFTTTAEAPLIIPQEQATAYETPTLTDDLDGQLSLPIENTLHIEKADDIKASERQSELQELIKSKLAGRVSLDKESIENIARDAERANVANKTMTRILDLLLQEGAENVTGWLRWAINHQDKLTDTVSYKSEKKPKSSFANFSQRHYVEYKELYSEYPWFKDLGGNDEITDIMTANGQIAGATDEEKEQAKKRLDRLQEIKDIAQNQ